MYDILFARTFIIVGGMLLITSFTAKINKTYETAKELWITLIGTFVFLFGVMYFANNYPLNIILVSIFSGLIGWQIGPIIEYYGERYKQKKYFKSKGIIIKKGEKLTQEQTQEFETSFDKNQYRQEWKNVITQAIFGTSIAVISTAGIVYFTKYDFSFLGGFLFIALCMLIIMGLVNAIFFRSGLFSLIKAYFGAIIFTLYLLYDFDRLEKMAGDKTWGTAIDISVNIYLDIINLFLDLLEILAEADN